MGSQKRRSSQMQCSEGCEVGDSARFIDGDCDCDCDLFWIRDSAWAETREGPHTHRVVEEGTWNGRGQCKWREVSERVGEGAAMYLYVFGHCAAGGWERSNKGSRGRM